MNKRNLFSLLFLVISFHVYGQLIPDTVRLEINKSKGTLIVKRKEFKDSQLSFQLNRHPDSTLIKAKDVEPLLRFINLYGGKQKVVQDELIKKLQDTSLINYPYKIELEKHTSSPPSQTPDKEAGQQKPKFGGLNYWQMVIGGLLLVTVVGLLIWALWERKEKRKLQRKQKQEQQEELVDLLNKYFDNGYGFWSLKDPDQLVAQLANNQKELGEERNQFSQQVNQQKKELSEKEGKISNYMSEITLLKNELNRLPVELENKFNSQQAVEKDRINSLCAKMIERKNLFINSLRGLDEKEAKKELLHFSVGYAEMAVAVLNEIRGKNNGSGKKNIQLLTGNKEPFGNTFDKHTPENAVDKEYILLAKLLSDYGIESIDDVYFNGDKYQQKNQ